MIVETEPIFPRSLICVFTLDRIGRRVTLFWGTLYLSLLSWSCSRKHFTDLIPPCAGGAVQAFALIMAGVFVHLLTVHPEKTAQYGGAATAMVFLVRQDFLNR